MKLIPLVIDFFRSNWQFIISVLIGLGIFGSLGKIWRQIKLRNPVEIYFLIPRIDMCRLNYVEQDDTEHLTKKIILPQNKKCLVLLWIRPKINYHQTDLYFGCDGSIYKKPMPLSYFNPFIKEGKHKKGKPRENPDHYLDWWLYYHMQQQKDRIKDEKYVAGFIIQTREPGEYTTKVFVHTLTRLGKAKLTIEIVGKLSQKPRKVPCVKYKQNKILQKIKREGHKKHELNFNF